MKKIIVLLLFVFLFSVVVLPVEAAKKVVTSISAGGQWVKAKNVVKVSFSNMKGVSKVSYTLYYEGNGIGQGAMGSVAPGKKTSYSNNVYLGTCSTKVCTPHKNVKNIQLEVVTKFVNGKSSTKTYKIK